MTDLIPYDTFSYSIYIFSVISSTSTILLSSIGIADLIQYDIFFFNIDIWCHIEYRYHIVKQYWYNIYMIQYFFLFNIAIWYCIEYRYHSLLPTHLSKVKPGPPGRQESIDINTILTF